VLREQEWNAKPEFEKRRMVVSVDLVGGKVVRRMGEVERPSEDDDHSRPVGSSAPNPNNNATGAFAKNPLLGALIRPTWKPEIDHEGAAGQEGDVGDKENAQPKVSMWRRVQDDETDNEAWILDGVSMAGEGGMRNVRRFRGMTRKASK